MFIVVFLLFLIGLAMIGLSFGLPGAPFIFVGGVLVVSLSMMIAFHVKTK